MSTYSVNDKVALVTGATRGIGFETARLLAERGARVALVGRNPIEAEEAAAKIGVNAIGFGADVTDTAAMQEVVDRTVAHFGRLDVVVANAGIAPDFATINTMDPAVFERIIDVNVLGVYRTVQPALPHIIANGGHVVVTASIYAFVNGILVAPYAMSKAAGEQYGRALRAELAQHGASAGVAYLGFIETEMTKNSFAGPIAERFEATFPKFLMKKLQPSEAGQAIVDGIETRAPRTIAPKRWTVYSVLRGVLNPVLDIRTERHPAIQAVLREAELAGASLKKASIKKATSQAASIKKRVKVS